MVHSGQFYLYCCLPSEEAQCAICMQTVPCRLQRSSVRLLVPVVVLFAHTRLLCCIHWPLKSHLKRLALWHLNTDLFREGSAPGRMEQASKLSCAALWPWRCLQPLGFGPAALLHAAPFRGLGEVLKAVTGVTSHSFALTQSQSKACFVFSMWLSCGSIHFRSFTSHLAW